MPLWMRNLAKGNMRIWEDDSASTKAAALVHPQMQMYANGTSTGASASKVHVVDAYTAPAYGGGPHPGSGDIAMGGISGGKLGTVNGNVGGVVLGNAPTLPHGQVHRTVSMEYEEGTDVGSPMREKFASGGGDERSRSTTTPSPEVAAYPPRKFA